MEPPFSWKGISEKEKEERRSLFGCHSTALDPIVSVPNGIIMPKAYELSSNEIYNFKARPDDVWIVTYKKCGTTWTQEIVWNIMNDLNKELGKLPLYERSPFLERQTLFSKHMIDETTKNLSTKEAAHVVELYTNSIEYTANLPSPRIIKTHLPLELLPPNLLDTAKVVYVCRNPKDCCVSFYHHVADVFKELYQYKGDFEQFVDLFMQGKLEQGNYFHHLKSAWNKRHHPNLKILWYEDLKKNPIKEVTELSKFLNHPLSDETVSELVDYLDFNNVKERASTEKKSFFRKGIIGDGDNYFKGDKLKIWDDWVHENIKGTEIEFTYRG